MILILIVQGLSTSPGAEPATTSQTVKGPSVTEAVVEVAELPADLVDLESNIDQVEDVLSGPNLGNPGSFDRCSISCYLSSFQTWMDWLLMWGTRSSTLLKLLFLRFVFCFLLSSLS